MILSLCRSAFMPTSRERMILEIILSTTFATLLARFYSRIMRFLKSLLSFEEYVCLKRAAVFGLIPF